ncbi:MAG: PAS domain-containing protein [Rhizomicrobium sp.]
MKHRNSHLLAGYWSRLRAGRDAPDQADIDPRALKRILPNIFILDSHNCARPDYRLAGTALCDRFGRELRGTGFLAHWEASAHEPLARLLALSLRNCQPVWLSATGTTAQCAVVEMETVLAPLAFGAGAPRRFLGITQFLGDLTPLGGKPIAYERLTGSGTVRENDVADPMDPPPPQFHSRFPVPAGPRLRLVVSHEPTTLHCDLDEGMQRLVGALEILPRTRVTH